MTESKQPPLRAGDVVSGEMVFIYAATRNSDLNEGRGPTIDESYHLKRHAAIIACAGIDVMGSNGQVAERLALKLIDGRYFLLANMKDPFEVADPIVVSTNVQEVQAMTDLKVKALGKLSPPERAALGLNVK